MTAALPQAAGRPLRRAGAATALGLFAAIVVWFRLGPTTRGTAWAEDAREFLADRLRYGPVDSIWRPYAGYQQLVPRVVVDVVVQTVPADRWALGFAAGSCIVLGAVVAAVFVLSRDVVRPWPLGALVALVPAVVPLGPYEIQGNTANLHWFLLFLTPWVFLARPVGRRSAWTLAAITFVVLCTEIQAAMFLPLLLVRPRTRRVLPVAGAAGVGILVEVVSLLVQGRRAAPDRPGSPADVATGYLLQVVGGSARTRLQDVAADVVAHGWAALAVVALVVLAVVVLGAVAARDAHRWMIVATAAASVVVWILAVVLNATDGLFFAHMTPSELRTVGSNPLRYAAVASMFLCAAVVLAGAALLGTTRSRRRGAVPTRAVPTREVPTRALPAPVVLGARIVGAIAVAAVVATAAANLPVHATRRSAGPLWSTQVQHWAPECAADPSARVELRAAPNDSWDVIVGCARLSARR